MADVFLDGRRIAVHSDPYAPFTVALPQLRDGRPHELIVRADNHKAKEPREGWWNWGGMTRQASLVPLGQLSVDQPGFLPRRRRRRVVDRDRRRGGDQSRFRDGHAEARRAADVAGRRGRGLRFCDHAPARAGRDRARPVRA